MAEAAAQDREQGQGAGSTKKRATKIDALFAVP